MHFPGVDEILRHGGAPVTAEVLDQTNTKVVWKECLSCGKIKPYGQFRRDSSYREGLRDQCYECEMVPRLSTSEHIARLTELNYYDERTKAQRWKHQLDYMDDGPRWVNHLHHSEFLYRLKKMLPSELYITDGRIIGDLAVYRVYGQPQPRLDGKTFEYLWYIPTGYMPEFSVYEFDPIRDIPIKERVRGWRTPLLRLIKARITTEEKVNKYFGRVTDGPGSVVYRRSLFVFRNGHE